MRKRHTYFAVFAALLLVAMTGCASMQSARHQYLMRGQVLEANETEVLICVGSSDGARVGQELSAYEFTASTPIGRAVTPPYQRIQTGTVRISEVLDEHYAKASITSGAPGVHDLVELSR